MFIKNSHFNIPEIPWHRFWNFCWHRFNHYLLSVPCIETSRGDKNVFSHPFAEYGMVIVRLTDWRD